jgi:hypothetical protein
VTANFVQQFQTVPVAPEHRIGGMCPWFYRASVNLQSRSSAALLPLGVLVEVTHPGRGFPVGNDVYHCLRTTMNRLLFVIPHYCRHDPSSALGAEREPLDVRAAAIARTVTRLYETFGPSAMVHPEVNAPAARRNVVDVVVVTTGHNHALSAVGPVASLVHHEETNVAPLDLPFAAHRVLAREVRQYDGFGYLEDDIVVHDPFVFDKQRWIGSVIDGDSLLMPSRYEASGVAKVYPDADNPAVALGLEELTLPPGPQTVTTQWMGIELTFVRPSNPNAACFFVDAGQIERLARHRLFGVPNAAWVGPIETAAIVAVTETFRVYKTASPNTDFLEVEHQGSHYLSTWGIPPEAHILEAARRAAEIRAQTAEAEAAVARGATEAAKLEVDELRASTSWRITEPGRRLRRVVAPLRRAWHSPRRRMVPPD